MALKNILIIPVCALSLSACSGNNEGMGTLLGAVLGGVVGSEVSGGSTGAVVVGAALGAAAGNSVGRQLDEADRERQRHAWQNSLENGRTGERSNWYNPDTDNRGYYVPQPAYQSAQGQYCREYTQSVTIGGREETMYGTACRQADGSWKLKPRS
jgi:surface antigen